MGLRPWSGLPAPGAPASLGGSPSTGRRVIQLPDGGPQPRSRATPSRSEAVRSDMGFSLPRGLQFMLLGFTLFQLFSSNSKADLK